MLLVGALGGAAILAGALAPQMAWSQVQTLTAFVDNDALVSMPLPSPPQE